MCFESLFTFHQCSGKIRSGIGYFDLWPIENVSAFISNADVHSAIDAINKTIERVMKNK